MGTHSRASELRAQLKSVGGDISGRHVRYAWSLPLFATFVTLAFVFVIIVPPYGTAPAFAVTAPGAPVEGQTLTVSGDYTHTASRDAFTTSEVYVAPPVSAAPAAGVALGVLCPSSLLAAS